MAVSHLPGKLDLSAYMFEPCHPASYGCCLNTHQSSATTDILQTHTMFQPASTRVCVLLHKASCFFTWHLVSYMETHPMACKRHGCTATQRSTSPCTPQSRKGLLGHRESSTLLCHLFFKDCPACVILRLQKSGVPACPMAKHAPYLVSASQLIIQVLDALCQGPAVHQEGAAAPDEHGCQQITLDTMACQESALPFDPVEALSQHKWPPACKIVRLNAI